MLFRIFVTSEWSIVYCTLLGEEILTFVAVRWNILTPHTEPAGKVKFEPLSEQDVVSLH